MRLYKLLHQSKASFEFKLFNQHMVALWGYFDVLPSKQGTMEELIQQVAQLDAEDPPQWLPSFFKDQALKPEELKEALSKQRFKIWTNAFQKLSAMAEVSLMIEERWKIKPKLISISEAIGKSLVLLEFHPKLREITKPVDLTKEISELFSEWVIEVIGRPDGEKIIKQSNIPAARAFISAFLKSLLGRVFSSPIIRSIDLQRSLQPLPLPQGKLDSLEDYFDDLKDHPELVAKMKAVLSLPPEEINTNVQTIYEQMLIDIISQLVADTKTPINILRIYKFPPNKKGTVRQVNGRTILSIGIKEIQKRFNLSAKEVRRLFTGERRLKPAVERLSGRLFVIRGRGYIAREALISITTLKIEDEEGEELLDVLNFAVHPIFNHLQAYQADNLKKLRHLKNIIGDEREEQKVLALRNALITLGKPFTYSIETLAKIAGLGYIKQRRKSLIKETVLRYLGYLKEIGDIDFEEKGSKILIWSLVSYKQTRKNLTDR